MADGPLVSDSTALIHITLSTQQTGNEHFFEASDIYKYFFKKRILHLFL